MRIFAGQWSSLLALAWLVSPCASGLSRLSLAGEAQHGMGLVQERPDSERFVKTKLGYMIPYRAKIAGTEASFEMVPIPGGTFRMGSPADEANRAENEGPQFTVEVEPFWMGKYEVTWSQYKQFMNLYDVFKDFSTLRTTLARGKNDDKKEARAARLRLLEKLNEFPHLNEQLEKLPEPVDAITAPTQLYEPSFTYEYGEDPQQPAVTMTQYAAKHYTKWLSAVTGHFYRLPTEAEWEYACRAGTTTAYHFGDDPAELGDYAWYFENNMDTIHLVGKKRPNSWGLYDMHGNAAEWVLDELTNGYDEFAGKTVAAADAVAWPTKLYPRVVRGGHWDSDAEDCRSAARMGSHDDDWKSYDPNIPLSPWWFTSDPARGVGFRIIRPLKKPSPELPKKVWEADHDDIRDPVADRLQEGRGALGRVHIDLPKAIAELRKLRELQKQQ